MTRMARLLPVALLCLLVPAVASSRAVGRTPTGWIYGQFTFNASQVNSRMEGFEKLRLRGPLMRGYAGLLMSIAGSANRTLTLAAKVPAGRHALKNIEAEYVVSTGFATTTERVTVSLKGQPVIEVPDGGAVDLGVLLILDGNKDTPARLVQIAEHAALPAAVEGQTRQRWLPDEDAAANLARLRPQAAILDWIPTLQPGEEFLTATLGRVYWRRDAGAWTALDLPTVAHVGAVAWHPRSARYWFAADGGQYWHTGSLEKPDWVLEQRADVALRTRHLGVLEDGRLWSYRQGTPVGNGKSRQLVAQVATGAWVPVGLPRNNIEVVDTVEDTPDGPWLISLDRLRYDATTRKFARYPGRPPVRFFRQSHAGWTRMAHASDGLIETSSDRGQSWQRWGNAPGRHAAYSGADIRADGRGVLLDPDTKLKFLNMEYRQIVYLTDDHGANWRESARLPYDCNQLLPALAQGAELVVRCASGIRSSSDGGATWTRWTPRLTESAATVAAF